jgi:hypothetical protein
MRTNSPRLATLLILAVLCLLGAAAAQAQNVKVTLATPAQAEQETSNLEVIIDGRGFDAGTQFTFLVSGSDSDMGGIVVRNSQNVFISQKQMKTYVDVEEAAVIGDFDIEAVTHSGRRGKGNTLFHVLQKGSSEPGGFGELGNGCVSFASGSDAGTFHDDDGGVYCNGSDGQVSVPKRLRLDSKKFNSNERSYWLDAICNDQTTPNAAVCTGPVEVGALQTQLRHEWIGGELVPTDELDFQGMAPGEISRVSVDLYIDRNTKVQFGNDNGLRVRCDGATAAPLWASCEADKNGDGFCDSWLLTTANLDGDLEPDARACLKNTRNGKVLDGDVTADFLLEVCVLGVDACP